MATTTFTNGVTLSDADWFNDVDRVVYDILNDPADLAAMVATLGATNWTITGTLRVDGNTNLNAGTVSAPGLYLESETGTGLYRIGANNHGYSVSGVKVLDIASTGLSVTGAVSATGKVTGTSAGGDYAIRAVRSAGDTVAFLPQLAGSGSTLLSLNSAESDYEPLAIWAENLSVHARTGVGTVSQVGLFSSTGLAVTGTISATERINANAADYQIGIYDGVGEPWYLRQNNDILTVHRNATGDIATFSSTGLAVTGVIEGAEQTAPAAPAANGYRIFAEDNGSGKTRLMVRFATGASQQIAIEP